MLLSGLFRALFQEGIILFATANCQPDQLYRNGLQRERFLPTIDLINQYCQILSVHGEVNQRLDHYNASTEYRDYTFLLKKNENTLTKKFLT